MTVPSAPVEAGGDKILFMVYGSAGTNYAAVYRGIEPITVNGDVLASMAVGTHGDGRDFTANDAIVVVGGVGLGSSTVRKLLTDSTGRLITRPPGRSTRAAAPMTSATRTSSGGPRSTASRWAGSASPRIRMAWLASPARRASWWSAAMTAPTSGRP